MKEIKTFLDGASGKELKDYLFNKLQELKDISTIKETETPTAQAIELKSQKRAYLKLKEIFEVIITIEEDKSKNPKDSYDV